MVVVYLLLLRLILRVVEFLLLFGVGGVVRMVGVVEVALRVGEWVEIDAFFIQKVFPFLVQPIRALLLDLLYLGYICVLQYLQFLYPRPHLDNQLLLLCHIVPRLVRPYILDLGRWLGWGVI